MKIKTAAASVALSLFLSSCGDKGGEITVTDAAEGSITATEATPPKPKDKVATVKVPPVIQELLTMYESKDEFDRVEAIMTLATNEDRTHPAVLELFKTAADDPSGDVRAEAIKVLPELSGMDCLDLLKAKLTDHDTTVRKAAITAVASLEDSACALLLVPSLEDDESSVQLEALNALANLGNSDVADAVKPFLFDPDGTKIQAAVRTMVAIDAKQEIDTIRGLLIDMNSDVRSAAAQALGSLGASDKKSLIGLAGLCTDELLGVRRCASESLTKLTGAEIEYFYDEADQDALKDGAKLWSDWIAKNK